MYRFVPLVTLLLFYSGCRDEEFRPLEDTFTNIFADEGEQLFNVTDVEFQADGTQRRVVLEYTTVFDRLNPEQQARIEGVRIMTDGSAFFQNIGVGRFAEGGRAVGEQACYTFSFRTDRQDSRGTEFCVTVE